MNITKKQLDDLSLQVTVSLEEVDYNEKVRKALNDIRRKLEIKGFRKGMVPMGIVQKMYGKSTLLEQVQTIVSQGIDDYMKQEEIHIIGEPLANGMKPIFCVGESLEEREQDLHFQVVSSQLRNVLFQLEPADFEKIVVAYEPVWAIGTGKTASVEQAQEMHAFIRAFLAGTFGTLAASTPILYGGSCKPSNARDLFSQPDIDGGLIGGASLTADDFLAIARSFA
jgi:hypothetical protein